MAGPEVLDEGDIGPVFVAMTQAPMSEAQCTTDIWQLVGRPNSLVSGPNGRGTALILTGNFFHDVHDAPA